MPWCCRDSEELGFTWVTPTALGFSRALPSNAQRTRWCQESNPNCFTITWPLSFLLFWILTILSSAQTTLCAGGLLLVVLRGLCGYGDGTWASCMQSTYSFHWAIPLVLFFNLLLDIGLCWQYWGTTPGSVSGLLPAVFKAGYQTKDFYMKSMHSSILSYLSSLNKYI